jgi:hypothetical protein
VREIRLQCADSDLPNLLVAVDVLLRQEPDQDEDENDEDEDEGGRKEDEDEDEDESDGGYSE